MANNNIFTRSELASLAHSFTSGIQILQSDLERDSICISTFQVYTIANAHTDRLNRNRAFIA